MPEIHFSEIFEEDPKYSQIIYNGYCIDIDSYIVDQNTILVTFQKQGQKTIYLKTYDFFQRKISFLGKFSNLKTKIAGWNSALKHIYMISTSGIEIFDLNLEPLKTIAYSEKLESTKEGKEFLKFISDKSTYLREKLHDSNDKLIVFKDYRCQKTFYITIAEDKTIIEPEDIKIVKDIAEINKHTNRNNKMVAFIDSENILIDISHTYNIARKEFHAIDYSSLGP